ncbi:MAG TPA: nuclear transport factor 2 family protein [Puia sp.]|nr:nuclear transport factor 2 family protein [Puia sp.]
MRKTCLYLILLHFTAIHLCAQNKEKEIESIKKANSDWVNSIFKKDTVALSSILADDIIFINSQGAALSKREILTMVSDPKRVYKSIKIDKIVEAKIIGYNGIIVCETATYRMLNGEESFLKMSVMNMFEKRKGKWVIVASHNTLLEARQN